MTLWIVLTIMVASVAVALAVPVIRRLEAKGSDRDRILQVSRDQMAEIEAEQQRGVMSEGEAAEAKAEVERRTLAVIKAAPAPLAPISERGRLGLLVGLTGWVVAGAVGLYAYLGRPDLPAQSGNTAAAEVVTDQDMATTEAEAGGGTGSVEEAVASLVARLKDNPEDAEGWRMLGWSYFNTERYAEAAEAYGKAVKLDGSLPDVWSAYGETLVRSARGQVTDEAIAAFDEALKLNPEDPRARFFKGMALEQAGDPKAAIEAWIALADSAPDGADWLSGVIARIDELAAANVIDLGDRLDAARAKVPSSLPPSGGLEEGGATADRGPTEADVAAAEGMSPEDRQAMIQGMVEQLATRLKENPDDPDGWVKLIRSRLVLEDAEGATAAYAEAKAALGSDPAKLAIITEGARAAGLDVGE